MYFVSPLLLRAGGHFRSSCLICKLPRQNIDHDIRYDAALDLKPLLTKEPIKLRRVQFKQSCNKLSIHAWLYLLSVKWKKHVLYTSASHLFTEASTPVFSKQRQTYELFAFPVTSHGCNKHSVGLTSDTSLMNHRSLSCDWIDHLKRSQAGFSN